MSSSLMSSSFSVGGGGEQTSDKAPWRKQTGWMNIQSTHDLNVWWGRLMFNVAHQLIWYEVGLLASLNNKFGMKFTPGYSMWFGMQFIPRKGMLCVNRCFIPKFWHEIHFTDSVCKYWRYGDGKYVFVLKVIINWYILYQKLKMSCQLCRNTPNSDTI